MQAVTVKVPLLENMVIVVEGSLCLQFFYVDDNISFECFPLYALVVLQIGEGMRETIDETLILELLAGGGKVSLSLCFSFTLICLFLYFNYYL